MANYCATCRSNYFQVNDPVVFNADMARFTSIAVYEAGEAFMVADESTGSWPQEDAEGNDVDFVCIIAGHLKENEVAVLVEAGHEKLRYITGFAEAVNGRNERRFVDLNDIYAKAEELGDHVTRAEY